MLETKESSPTPTPWVEAEAEAEAGTRRTRGAEAGKSPPTLGKASLFLSLALHTVSEEAGGDQWAPNFASTIRPFLKGK